MLSELERLFYRLTARRFDRDLSLEIVGVLREAYSASEREAFAEMFERFAERHSDKLKPAFFILPTRICTWTLRSAPERRPDASDTDACPLEPGAALPPPGQCGFVRLQGMP